MSTTNQIDSKIKEILDVFKQINMNFPTRGTCQNINSFSNFFAIDNGRGATVNGPVIQENAGDPPTNSTQNGPVIQENAGDPPTNSTQNRPVIQENAGDPPTNSTQNRAVTQGNAGDPPTNPTQNEDEKPKEDANRISRPNCSNDCIFIGLIISILLVVFAVFLVLVFKNICWYDFIYGIVFFPILLVFVLLLIKFSLSHYLKLIAFTQKNEDGRIEFERQQINREREFQELTRRAEIDVYVKYEKAQIDEWIRDNDHIRKLELSQSERISELGKFLFELSKIKNTITFKQGEKEIKIESSALSNIDLDKTKLFFEGLHFHMR